MGFNSFTFILLFLPAMLAGWYILNHFQKYTVADLFLTGMSLYYYYTFGATFLIILLASMTVNYLLGFFMDKVPDKAKELLKVLGVLFNLGLLFYLKYLGFFMDNINKLTGGGFTVQDILMPVGISFFTFGQISYIIDRAKGKAPLYSVLEYALFACRLCLLSGF